MQSKRISFYDSENTRKRIVQIFDSIPDEILLIDTDMLVQEANASFLSNNNLTIDQVRGYPCYEVEQHIRGKCKAEVENCPFYKVMARKVKVSQVRKHFDKDNNVHYAAIVGAPVIDKDGNMLGMIEMTRDITHRILIEEELKSTELQLQQFMEMAPLATYVKNPHGQYMEINPATCSLFGKTRNEIIGKKDADIFPRAAAESMLSGDQEVLKSGKEVRSDTKLKLGSKKVFLSNIKYPVLDVDGNVSAVCGISEDVTMQRAAEVELVRTREYFENILDNSPVLITTADLDGRVVSFNRGAEEHLGYKAEEVIGKPAAIFYPNKKIRQSMMRSVEKSGDIRDFETVVRRKDGTELNISLTLSYIKDSEGNLIGTVGIGKDISARKALMEQVMQSDRQAAVGRLASGVAHEINNPLAMIGEIAGYLNDLVSGGPGSDSADLMEELIEGLPKILGHVEMGRSITHRMLNYARKIEATAEVVANANAALEEVIPFIAKEATLARVTIHQEYQPELPPVAIEELQLQEIFINLIKNAVQAMRSESGESNLWLKTQLKKNKVMITVKDDGPGISEKVRNRLFDPFVTTKPPGQGTGLGLSICYGIVKRYDGEIQVESESGKGSTFKVILPIYKETTK
jgi:two-component system NtrC family sensor kinase